MSADNSAAARALVALRSGAPLALIVSEKPLHCFELVPAPELFRLIERDLILLAAGDPSSGGNSAVNATAETAPAVQPDRTAGAEALDAVEHRGTL